MITSLSMEVYDVLLRIRLVWHISPQRDMVGQALAGWKVLKY